VRCGRLDGEIQFLFLRLHGSLLLDLFEFRSEYCESNRNDSGLSVMYPVARGDW